jgi:hypothetical protein
MHLVRRARLLFICITFWLWSCRLELPRTIEFHQVKFVITEIFNFYLSSVNLSNPEWYIPSSEHFKVYKSNYLKKSDSLTDWLIVWHRAFLPLAADSCSTGREIPSCYASLDVVLQVMTYTRDRVHIFHLRKSQYILIKCGIWNPHKNLSGVFNFSWHIHLDYVRIYSVARALHSIELNYLLHKEIWMYRAYKLIFSFSLWNREV